MKIPGEIILGRLGAMQVFIYANDGTIAARIDDDGIVRLSKEVVAKIRESAVCQECKVDTAH